MQQRVSLARALVFQPRILLMDEPFAALDEITREAMQDELLRLWSRIDTTVVFITHSIPEAVLLSERIPCVLWPGPAASSRRSMCRFPVRALRPSAAWPLCRDHRAHSRPLACSPRGHRKP